MIAEHERGVRRRLSGLRATEPDEEELLAAARRALESGGQRLRSKDLDGADRFIAAADSFVHAAEHPSHIAAGLNGPAPSGRQVAEHLQHVYFQLQQAEFFARRISEENEKSLPAIARNYYERARKAYDAESWLAAGEYAKSADDTVRGLENLAQATSPEPPRPPRPR